MRYLYRCPECQSEKEVSHLMSEEPIVECPNAYRANGAGDCGSYEFDSSTEDDYFQPSLMRRVITPDCANFILNGAGYYSVDKRVIKTPGDIHGHNIKTDARGNAL